MNKAAIVQALVIAAIVAWSVLVAARKRIAYYDSRDPQRTGRSMIGQHGSLTVEETRVPLLRFGAAER